MKTRTVLGLSLLSVVAGCGDPLKDASRIEELRVLGAQVDIEGSKGRATPEPGDRASVRWLLADPTGLPPEAIWSMQVCVAEETSYGIPICRDEPFAMAEQLDLDPAAPEIAFDLPTSAELADADRLAVLAIFCDGGSLDIRDDFFASSCDDASTIQRASFDVFLTSSRTNDNPDLTGASVEFDGNEWAESAGDADCTGLSVPADGSKHEITLDVGAAARETEDRGIDGMGLESLQISHSATLGLLDRPFSDVAPEDADPAIHVSWKAPKAVEDAMPSSFYFVVRDDRGGVSWLTRTLCVEP